MSKHKAKAKNESFRKENGIKNMYFNRYLMVRYFLAALLFSNFYWMLFSMDQWIKIIPLLLLLLGVAPCIENIRSYGEKKIAMTWTKRYFRVQCIVNILMMGIVFTPFFKSALPFLQDQMTSRIFIFIIVLIGFLMSVACLVRFAKIDANRDKHYQRILQYEKIVNSQT